MSSDWDFETYCAATGALAVLLFVLFIISCFFVTFATPNSGDKTGIIVKVAQEGVIAKTWEAELIKGGMNNGSGGFGVKPFDFTLTEQQADVANQTMISGQEVVVKYHSNFISWNWSTATSTNTYADDIKIIK